jgi:hypothetical protein
MHAARECRANICYYVAHVDYIEYIGGLTPIGEGVIFICLHLQQLLVGYEPRHHRWKCVSLLMDITYVLLSSESIPLYFPKFEALQKVDKTKKKGFFLVWS